MYLLLTKKFLLLRKSLDFGAKLLIDNFQIINNLNTKMCRELKTHLMSKHNLRPNNNK